MKNQTLTELAPLPQVVANNKISSISHLAALNQLRFIDVRCLGLVEREMYQCTSGTDTRVVDSLTPIRDP